MLASHCRLSIPKGTPSLPIVPLFGMDYRRRLGIRINITHRSVERAYCSRSTLTPLQITLDHAMALSPDGVSCEMNTKPGLTHWQPPILKTDHQSRLARREWKQNKRVAQTTETLYGAVLAFRFPSGIAQTCSSKTS